MEERPTDPEVMLPHAPVATAIDRPLLVRAAGLTDIGQKRSTNEDQFLIAEIGRALRIQQSSLPQPRTVFGDQRAHLLVVADGMGGHQAGEQASALAVQTIEDFILNTFTFVLRLQGENVVQEFHDALKAADARVFEEAARRPELAGMGTTLTLAYTVSSCLFVVHAGDSRCYLRRDQQLFQLTNDHTLVNQMVRNGVLPAADARKHHLRNIITNAVGGSEKGIQVEVHKATLEPGDVVLLCSDGLTEMVPDVQLGEVLKDEPDPAAACRQLVDLANQAGGRDNITAIVARFDAVQLDDQ